MEESRKSKAIKMVISGLAILIIGFIAFAQEKPAVDIPLVSGSTLTYYHIDIDFNGNSAVHADAEGEITFTDEEIMFNPSQNDVGDSSMVFVIEQEFPVKDTINSKGWVVHKKDSPAERYLIQKLNNVGVFVVSASRTMMLFVTNKEAASKGKLPEPNKWYPLELK